MRYGSCQNCTVATRLELVQFHCFLRDSGLTPEFIPRAKADVLFFQDNTGKSISFFRWVDILAQIAKSRFKTSRSIDSLSRLVLEVILPSPSIRSNDLPTAEWETAIARIRTVVGSIHGTLEGIFRLYRSRRAGANGQMSIGNYLIFSTESHVVPELVSKVLAVRVFRTAKSDSFSEFASLEEFEKMFCYLAFIAFKEKGSEEAVRQMVKWVSLSTKAIRSVEMRKKLD